MLTMLTLASQTNYSRNEVIIQSTTACDIYIWLCFTFVIAAMCEFALSDYFNKPRFRTDPKLRPPRPNTNSIERYQTQKVLQGSPLHDQLLTEANDSPQTKPANENGEGLRKRTKPKIRRRQSEAVYALANHLSSEHRSASSQVDLFSRKAFPLAFLLFNLVYWVAIAFFFRRNHEI